MKFLVYAEIVLKRARLNIVHGTWMEYRIQVNKDLAPLHDRQLEEITENDCIETLLAVKKRYSVERHRKTHTLLKRIFKEAVKDGELLRNPMDNLRKPKRASKLYSCYTASEAAQIMAGSRGTDNITRAIVLLELNAGFRRGEVLALDWDSVLTNISLAAPNGSIVVRQTLVRGDGGYQIVPTTKGRADRLIPINTGIWEALKLLSTLGECQGWLFKRKRDPTSPISFEEYHRRWHDYLQQIQKENPEFRYLAPHKLRHTYATQMLASGADIESVRVLMGHSDIKTTEIYLHADNERLRNCSEALHYE